MKKGIYIIIALVAATLTSCDKSDSPESKDKQDIVVNCVLTANPVQKLQLSYANEDGSIWGRNVENAVAALVDRTSARTVGQFAKQSGDYWTLNYTCIPNHIYRLEVQVPKHNLISSEQFMPEIDVIARYWCPQNTDLSSDSSLREQYMNYDCTIYQLPRNFDNIWIYALCYNPQTGKRETAKRICSDYPKVDDINFVGEVYNPEIHTVVKDGEEYQSSLYPNLRGKALHDRFLLLPREAGNKYGGKYLTVAGAFTGKMYSNLHKQFFKLEDDGKALNVPDDEGYIVFAAVSDEYDKYLREAIQSQQLQESTDLSSIYVRDNVYSNINGGLGIFGAINEEKMQWTSNESLIIED